MANTILSDIKELGLTQAEAMEILKKQSKITEVIPPNENEEVKDESIPPIEEVIEEEENEEVKEDISTEIVKKEGIDIKKLKAELKEELREEITKSLKMKLPKIPKGDQTDKATNKIRTVSKNLYAVNV